MKIASRVTLLVGVLLGLVGGCGEGIPSARPASSFAEEQATEEPPTASPAPSEADRCKSEAIEAYARRLMERPYYAEHGIGSARDAARAQFGKKPSVVYDALPAGSCRDLALPAPAVSSAPAVPTPTDVVLYDPQANAPASLRSSDGGSLSSAEATRALNALFKPGKYLSDIKMCPAKVGGDVASRRKSGMFAPRVLQAVDGAFTSPKAKQTLVFIDNGECNARAMGTYELAVLEGDVPKARENMETSGLMIGAIADVDGDGQNEIILKNSFYYQGETTSASLVRWNGTQFEKVEDFGALVSGGCSGLNNGTADYFVVHLVTEPGKSPRFSKEKVTEKCR